MLPRAAPHRWPARVNGCAWRRMPTRTTRCPPLQGRRCEGAKPKRLRKAAEKRLCES
jgi:hypothetical protein